MIKNIKLLDEALAIIASKGGRFISCTGQINAARITVECDNKHLWETNIKSIRTNHWCRFCSNIKNNSAKEKLHSLEEVQKIAGDKAGNCLSTKYQSRMRFSCSLGHEWEATASNIINSGSWCSICSSSLYERICRLFFETIFGEKFPTSYPKWLIGAGKRHLELDGYCKELAIAFEHNGKQHYERIKFDGKTDEFERLQINDNIKKELCKQHGIKLIVIPELVSKTKIINLKQFIIKECIKLNIKLPKNYKNIIIDYKLVFSSNKEIEALDKLRNKLYDVGYDLLSTKYLGSHFKYEVKCITCGKHRFAQYNLLLTHKCSFCLGTNYNISIETANKLAGNMGGKCLSIDYKNNHSKLLWECELGHQWNAKFNSIQNGTWCPECYKLHRSKNKILGIEIYKEAAIKKGGLCISNEVNSCRDYLEWQCNKGHIWKALAYTVKNESNWCPSCAKIKWQLTLKKNLDNNESFY